MEKLLPGIKNIHLIGIGGIGMSGLALLLKDKGFNVRGSDLKNSPNVKILRSKGIEVFIGHDSAQLSPDAELVSYSSAVKSDNPEILQAEKRAVSILKRGELLAKLCQGQKTIAVAGSHGKTTTTSLLGHIFTSLGYNPAIFLGGSPLNYSSRACWGDDYFVVETDESDGSFLYCHPWSSIITNIDSEHLDHYGTIERLRASFLQFGRQTEDKVVGFGDCSFVSEILSEGGGISFGWDEENIVRGANFKFDNGCSCFDLYIKGKFIIPVKVPLVGRHNCLNVLAVFAFFNHLGEDLQKAGRALEGFKGTARRFQVKAIFEGITFIDDYAHHPTEIKAVLKAARLLRPKRVFVIVQPHRFSRVRLLSEKFKECFREADRIVITDIYSAHEENQEGVNSREFFKKISKNFPGEIEYIPKDDLPRSIPPSLQKGDLVLVLGAGDINIVAEDIIDELKKSRNQA